MVESGHRDSNPVIQLGRLVHNPYAMPAIWMNIGTRSLHSVINPGSAKRSHWCLPKPMHTVRPPPMFKVVSSTWFEQVTPNLGNWCSIQLSYGDFDLDLSSSFLSQTISFDFLDLKEKPDELNIQCETGGNTISSSWENIFLDPCSFFVKITVLSCSL